MKVGFIGLGVMGKSMAINILNCGYKLKVYDVIKETMTELEEIGAEVGNSPADAAEGCDVIMTSLPNSKIVEDVYTGKRRDIRSCKGRSSNSRFKQYYT